MGAREKLRLDRLVFERGLAESRTRAQAMVLAGQVIVDDHTVDKPGTLVPTDAELRVRGGTNPFVSRGGLKLRAALDAFSVEVVGRVALDVGASTGGFTDCLLQAGATRVHAVDVGYGQLAWKLAKDPRVVVHDRTNVRALEIDQLGERVDLVVADCSFISLTKVLPHLPPLLEDTAEAVLLVKPQFEVGKERVGKGGIVRDDGDRQWAVDTVVDRARALGFETVDRIDSPVPGREGNRELLVWMRWTGAASASSGA